MTILTRTLMVALIAAALQLSAQTASAAYNQDASRYSGATSPGPTDPDGPPSL